MTKHIDQVMNDLNEESTRKAKRRAPNELKLFASADWGTRTHIQIPKEIIVGLAEHIRRVEAELAAARKGLNKSKKTDVVIPYKKSTDRFQIGDRVRSLFYPDVHRYIITGPRDHKGMYPCIPTTNRSTDRLKFEGSVERTPLKEFNWTDLQVGDTVEYSGVRYEVFHVSDAATARAKSGSSVYFEPSDLNKSVVVVDTPQ